MHNIQQHTFGLARYTYMLLSSLCHGNGRPAAQIYTEDRFESPDTQGAILNFSLLDSGGQIIGYSQVNFNCSLSHNSLISARLRTRSFTTFILRRPQVDRMAALYNIHVRTGCFCNTGACQWFLGITNQQLKKNLQVKEGKLKNLTNYVFCLTLKG